MGTLLSNRMRNAMTLGVSQDLLDTILRDLELFGDFSDAHAVIEVIYHCTDWHASASQYRSAALHLRIDLDQRSLRPVDVFRHPHLALPS